MFRFRINSPKIRPAVEPGMFEAGPSSAQYGGVALQDASPDTQV